MLEKIEQFSRRMCATTRSPGSCCYAALFLVFFKIGASTFGGGYSMIPLIQKEMVEKKCWLENEECVDIIGVTQVAPGAVAINMAIYIGYKLMGVPGALVAAAGMVLPSFLIIVAVAKLFGTFRDHHLVQAFFMGVRPGIVAMIAYAAYRMSNHVLQERVSKVIAGATMIAVVMFGIHPILLIVVGGCIGYSYRTYFSEKARETERDT